MNGKILDIVSLVNNNPLIKIDKDVDSKILSKIQETFSTEEQKLFVASFYVYNKYDTENDYVIELDKIWKWLGYNRVEECKRCLVKKFQENKHYKITKLAPQVSGASLQYGGQNKENVLMTIDCFKKLCIKSGTTKADEIHNYYIKMEKIIIELAKDESSQLRNQLQLKNKEILTIKEKTLVGAYDEKPTVYIILVEENIVKFGFSNHLENRLSTHKREIGSHVSLNYVVESLYNREIETMIKQKLYNKIISKEYSGKLQTELLHLDNEYTIENFYNDVISYKESLSNSLSLVKLLEENERLIKENEELKGKGKVITKVVKEEKIPNKIPDSIMSFLENFILYKNGIVDISNDELYSIYSQFSGISTETRKMFSDKLLYCPHITTSRITIDQNDENYIQGSDNRIGSKKIKVDLVKDWIITEKNKEPIDKIKVIEYSPKIKKRGDTEKYFDTFLEHFITRNMTIDSNELLEEYKKYISTNKTCASDVYPDFQFNRKISEKPFIKNIRISTEKSRTRTTSRVIDYGLFSKQ